MSNTPNTKILRLADVKARTALSRSTIYALTKEGLFPSSFKLGPRCVGWLESDISQWISDKAAKQKSKT
jgi:prophage regulatory protein